VAAAGTTVAVGASLFSVDFEPTIVLSGAVPAYRALDVDANDGPDVAQLEQALVDLGVGSGVTVDQDFDSGTAAAVERWETALGRTDPDGRVELGDIVFASGPVRVGTITSDVGTRVQEGSTVLEATPTVHVVTVDLEASRSNELEPGTAVALTMPDDTETTGTVATIGTEAEASDQNAGPGGGGGATVPVTITLDHPEAAAGFDTGTVEVAIERSRDEDALAVPVTALLALAEGGYAVELAGGGATHQLVGVQVGTFADGWVGITGDGIEPGVKVVVPA
jgi:peptidoglycan hydrolase-like protein with peptidoglycan-binding domain